MPPDAADSPLGLPLDTDLDVLREYYARLRRMTPEERFQQGLRLTERARLATEAGIRLRHPDYDEETVRLARIRLTIGEEVFQTMFPGIDVEP